MSDNELIGTILKVQKRKLPELSNYQVILGFAGFGNVGYLTLSHMIETMDLKSFSYWGNSSWYYRNNLESTLTAYKNEESKTILITTRIPIFVSTMAKQFWDKMIEDIINWSCKRYIVIGGLREDTRSHGSSDWAAFVPTNKWTEMYGDNRNFAEKLSMIGPLSSLLTLGTTSDIPVLGLLAYCNLEEDRDASFFALSQIQKIGGFKIPNSDSMKYFDFSFLSIPNQQSDEYVSEDDSDDFDSFDLGELI